MRRAAERKDRRVDLDRVDVARAVAHRGRDVVAGAGADDEHALGSRLEAVRDGVVVGLALLETTGHGFGAQIEQALEVGVVDRERGRSALSIVHGEDLVG